ncbi:MAG: Integral rane sensor signal transduction histidine kinase [Acidimicrobiales bacterium]|nr:Integral rane sensor signal transduction histidine kinase [Acidimicrobiales bacterium]
MTRRITVAIVGVVAGALVVTVLGMSVLLAAAARRDTRNELTRQVASFSAGAQDLESSAVLANGDAAQRLARRQTLVRVFRRALQLQDAAIMRFGPAGRTADTPPAGVLVADIPLARIQSGDVVSGAHGSLLYAMAGYPVGASTDVVILTRHTGTGRRGALAWFAIASLLAMVVAAIVARELGRRLTRPVADAAAAANRVAHGDLAARVPIPEGARDDELTDLAHSINDMATTLDRSRGLERQFLLSVSHDLRTPLTSIRGYAEAIAEGRAPDAARAAGVISAESRRLERLVRDLLELAKLDARRFSLDLRSTDVAEVVDVTAEGFRPAAEEAGVTMTVDADGRAAAAADPDRLAQVVANLTENALKFAAGRIVVGTASHDGSVVVWVDDDGPGIAPDDLPNVFERFYSSARIPARQVGTGLGLAIVRELAEAMGGAVRAEASPLGGARMVVTLRAWS